jgi:hypothetical protein
MRSSVSFAYRRAVQAQETGEAIVILVTVTHPDLPAPLRLNNAGVNIVSRGDTFLASFLEATIMDEDPDKLPQARLIFSNVKREIVDALQSTVVPPEILMEIIKGSDPDTVEFSLPGLELRNIEGDMLVIQGELTPKRVKAQPGIDFYFTPSTAPGVF